MPTIAIRPYVSEIMNYLVEVHSQVCDVASGLLDRAMNPLLDQLVNTAVETFGEIKRFGTGGLLLVGSNFFIANFKLTTFSRRC